MLLWPLEWTLFSNKHDVGLADMLWREQLYISFLKVLMRELMVMVFTQRRDLVLFVQ